MRLEEFLALVVAPGPYFAICYKRTDQHGMSTRMFPRDQLAEAAGFARWAEKTKLDVWYTPASYRMAITDKTDKLGRPQFTGERKQQNVQALRAFWVDIDLKRDGDKKSLDRVYADMPEAVAWLRSFLATTKLPVPNLWVQSGYGVHVYWVIEDAVALDEWQPYADALRTALIQSKGKIDVGITIDSARLLRPPETSNYKNRNSPAAVQVLTKYTRGEYPNQMIYAALQPYLSQVPLQATGTHSGSGMAGNVSSIFAGRQSNTAAAVTANLPTRKSSFARIAEQCVQVKTSLANHGNGDARPVWYLGHLSLAHFCEDGAQFVHEIGNGDPRYTQAETDAMVAQVAREKASGGGAPTCAHYETSRPGLCAGCPHVGKINSPISLGYDALLEMPVGWQQGPAALQRLVKSDAGGRWVDAMTGEFSKPRLIREGDVYSLQFVYTLAGHPHTVSFDPSSCTQEPARMAALLNAHGMSIAKDEAAPIGEFIMAWIKHLRQQHAEQDGHTLPFGWATTGGQHTGVAIAGTLYKPDGTTEVVPGTDRKLFVQHRPRGTLDGWKAAADFVFKGRPDLQVILGASFGAPLMRFTGHKGFTLSVWSRDSAVGKSSAMRMAQTAWAAESAMVSMKSTANAVRGIMGATKITPFLWDELRIDTDNVKGISDLLFELGQGQDKARMNSDASLKDVGEWCTILIIASNFPLLEHVAHNSAGTDAGAVRAFEHFIDHPQRKLDPEAALIIDQGNANAGNAGRAYAAWLAANEAGVRDRVRAVSLQFTKQLEPNANERYFIAGMACIFTGAQIANQLGLVTLDLRGIWRSLVATYTKLRATRVDTLVVNGGQTNLIDVLGQFMGFAAPNRLVTTRFFGSGRKPQDYVMVSGPAALGTRLLVHIGQNDKMLRIDKGAWDGWCHKAGFSSSELLGQMKLRWGAGWDARLMLGAGTNFASAKIRTIELPLSDPELEPYLYVTVSQAQAAPPAPAQAVAGNQARV